MSFGEKSRMKKLLSYGIIWNVFFAVGFAFSLYLVSGFAMCLFGPGDPLFLQDFCFPLSTVEDVAVDRDGQVYVALAYYGRIQIYDKSGKFIRGIFVDAHGGAFCLNFDKEGHIEITTAKGQKEITMDRNGKILKIADVSSLNLRLCFERAENGWEAHDGQKYFLHDGYFSPSIIKSNGAVEHTLIDTPFFLVPFVAPIPAFLCSLFFITIGSIGRFCLFVCKVYSIGKYSENSRRSGSK